MFVSSIEDGGAIVVLGDGSRWEIGLMDRIKTMLWLPAQSVVVERGIGNQTTLKNTSKNQSVVGVRVG